MNSAYKNDCIFGPQDKNFALNHCEMCRSTTRIGYYLRKIVVDRILCLRKPFRYTRLYEGFYNFDCPFFPWNYNRRVGSIDGDETLPLEGIKPLDPQECPNHKGTECSRFKKPIETRVRLLGDRVQENGVVPICELCLQGPLYEERLEKLFKVKP